MALTLPEGAMMTEEDLYGMQSCYGRIHEVKW